MGVVPVPRFVLVKDFKAVCCSNLWQRKKKLCRVEVLSLYSSSAEVILLRTFACQSSCCGCKGKPLVFSLHTAWVAGGEAKWRYGQSKWGSGNSGQMADFSMRCPHCGKDDQRWKRQGRALKCVTIWLPFIISMENYVVSSPQALWDFLWGWPPEGIYPALVTLIA